MAWFQKHVEPPLTRGQCILRESRNAELVKDVMFNRDEIEYKIWAWCIMPNHVHTVMTTAPTFDLTKILDAWKSVSSHRMKQGTVWEAESFNHLVRSAKSFDWFCHYVEQNPVVAGLCSRAEEYVYSSARMG
jgi:REP element-mobilizing transposase RayT